MLSLFTPSPDVPVSSPGLPVSSPDVPVPSPGLPVSSPDVPVPSPDVPVPSPDVPVSSPGLPVPSPGAVSPSGRSNFNVSVIKFSVILPNNVFRNRICKRRRNLSWLFIFSFDTLNWISLCMPFAPCDFVWLEKNTVFHSFSEKSWEILNQKCTRPGSSISGKFCEVISYAKLDMLSFKRKPSEYRLPPMLLQSPVVKSGFG